MKILTVRDIATEMGSTPQRLYWFINKGKFETHPTFDKRKCLCNGIAEEDVERLIQYVNENTRNPMNSEFSRVMREKMAIRTAERKALGLPIRVRRIEPKIDNPEDLFLFFDLKGVKTKCKIKGGRFEGLIVVEYLGEDGFRHLKEIRRELILCDDDKKIQNLIDLSLRNKTKLHGLRF